MGAREVGKEETAFQTEVTRASAKAPRQECVRHLLGIKMHLLWLLHSRAGEQGDNRREKSGLGHIGF